ncbi:MAG: type II toxin-antitoxin system VapC family toxin [Pseudomonadota bacterium]|nr:type II toxin-antitoxin system VapC family toxin [Pseudomonadota bacterium]
MPLVIDASVAAPWALADEPYGQASRRAFEVAQSGEACAPSLWWVELRNVLLVAERRRRIEAEVVDGFFTEIDALPIDLDRTPDGASLIRLARTHGLSAYDALYLELALRRGAELATLDRRLAAAAEAEGVRLV